MLRIHREAGLCRKPYCVNNGSPTKRETSRNTSPNARPIPTHAPPAHPHPILTRPSPNLPQILTLPSHLHSAPLTPQPNTCHHLLTPSPSKTTATTIRDRTLMATDRQSNHWQRQTKLVLNCCDHDTDPLLDPPKGTDPKRGPLLGSETSPQTMSPHNWGTQFRGSKWPAKMDPDLAPSIEATLSKFLEDCTCV